MGKRCGYCNKGYRTGRIVFVGTADGELVSRRVCQGCAKDGITVLFAQQAARCKCGEPATTCSKCAEKQAQRAKDQGADKKKLVLAIRRVAAAYERAPDESEQEHRDGRVAGLEQAADIVEAGKW